MDKLVTFTDLSNYIQNVNKWLELAYYRIDILDEKTKYLLQLSNCKNQIIESVANVNATNPTFKTFLSKMKQELSNFTLEDNYSNIKSFEGILSTLQLEYSVVIILYFCGDDDTKHVKDYFTKSLELIETVKKIYKQLSNIDYSLETLLRI